jgi:hypothetical protein
MIGFNCCSAKPAHTSDFSYLNTKGEHVAHIYCHKCCSHLLGTRVYDADTWETVINYSKVVPAEEVISVEEEPEDMGILEQCFYCPKKTSTWHTKSNTPVCESCARKHRISDLPISDDIKNDMIAEAKIKYGDITPLKEDYTFVGSRYFFWFNDSDGSTHIVKRDMG